MRSSWEERSVVKASMSREGVDKRKSRKKNG